MICVEEEIPRCWWRLEAVREGGRRAGMLNVDSSVMLGYVAVSLGSMLARR
jgi:hypothetical protein